MKSTPKEIIETQMDVIQKGLKPKKHIYFEDFLQDIHAEQYEGLDDDMPDNYDTWRQEMDVDDWMAYGEMFADKLQK